MPNSDILNFKLLTIGHYSFYVYNLLSVIVIFLVTKLLIFGTKKVLIKKTAENLSHRASVFQLSKYILWVVSITTMFQSVGISISLILAGSAALLVGVGMGLQQIFNDLVSGLFILFEGDIKVGDIMEVDGIVGQVEKIQLRSTEFLSRDGMNIIVPNHKFITENVINWSYNNAFKRFEIEVGVGYGSDMELVRALLIGCADAHPEVIHSNDTMQPLVRLVSFGDSSVNFQLLFWSKNIFRIENTRSDLRFAINKAFKDNNINIPFPQRDIHIKNDV